MTSRITLVCVPELEAAGAHLVGNVDVPHIVLLSGGIDSATCLALVARSGVQARALFVDYGQAAAISEARSARAVASHFRVGQQALTCRARDFGAGEIRGRNAFLVHVALLSATEESAVIVLGIHGGTQYRDCSREFTSLIQESLDFHAYGRVVLSAPLLDLSKPAVMALASGMNLPFELTYSCEAGDVPCGTCLSCRDRAHIEC